jgi:aminopeptidase C
LTTTVTLSIAKTKANNDVLDKNIKKSTENKSTTTTNNQIIKSTTNKATLSNPTTTKRCKLNEAMKQAWRNEENENKNKQQ